MSKTPETGRFIPTLTEVIDSPEQMDLGLKSDIPNVQARPTPNRTTEPKPVPSQSTGASTSSAGKVSRFGSFMDLEESPKRTSTFSSSVPTELFPALDPEPPLTHMTNSPSERVEPNLNEEKAANFLMNTQIQDSKSPTTKAQAVQSPPSLPSTSNVRMTVHIPNQPLVRPMIRPAVPPELPPTFKPVVKPSVQSVEPPTFRPVVKPTKTVAQTPQIEPIFQMPQQVDSTLPPVQAPVQSAPAQVSAEPHTQTKLSAGPMRFQSSAQRASQSADVEKVQDKSLEDRIDASNEPDVFASFAHNPAASPESLRPSDLMLIALSERIAAKARIRIEHSIEEHIHAQIFPMLDAFAEELVSHIQGDLLKIMREGIAQATREELDRLRPRKK